MNGEPCTIHLAPLGWRCAYPCDTVWFVTLRYFAALWPPLEEALAHSLAEHGHWRPRIVDKPLPTAADRRAS